MRYLVVCFLIAATLFALPGGAITADEYFEFASSKYIKGDVSGAVKDINKALEINPNHLGALELSALIEEERLMSVEEQPTTTTTTTTTIPPVSRRRWPSSAALRVKREIANMKAAHGLFLIGENNYKEGKFLIARDYFIRVDGLLPGHKKTNVYLDKINKKLERQETSIKQLKELTARIAPTGGSSGYEFRFMWVDGLLLLALVALLALAGRVMAIWWRTNHLFCPECRTRNPLDAEFCRKCGVRLKVPKLNDEQKGWFDKFGWTKNPFTLNIIPDIFTGHQVEISIIVEKLNMLSGHILVIGGLGTGKTTLLQWLEKNLKDNFETIYILRPPANPDELINLVSSIIQEKKGTKKKYTIYEFQDLCRKYRRNILLLIDEAHEFQEEFERFLRTLGDLPNIILVMAGLPQAREKLKRDLPALFDRIVENILLGSLNLNETGEMIQKRITNAGGNGLGPFTAGAIETIYNLSYGIPRGILKICDGVITQAIRLNKTYIDEKDLQAYGEQIEIAKIGDTSADE